MAPPVLNLDQLRRYAVARSLFAPTTLSKALQRLGFVQADPLRAPARAQDLTLRHRVAGYRVGDLESRYPRLPIEEDFFVNYGFVRRDLHHLMHPRTARIVWSAARMKQAHEVLAFVREADGQRIVCVFNFSDRAVTWALPFDMAKTATTLTEGGLTGAVLQGAQVVCEPWGGLWATY